MKYRLKDKPLITQEQIRARVEAMGSEITAAFAAQDLVMVGVLKGSFVFLADLIRSIAGPRLQIEFIGVSSYEGTSSTGNVRVTRDLSVDITGQNVILVEDVIDTGETIDYLIDYFKSRNPKSLKICTLLSKPACHKMRHAIDYVGFELAPEFVVGYGLDVDGYYRELPYIAVVDTAT
jgi:hypoxanthine phosphoribosyltransferase